jgi:hypothetical protein
MNNTLNLVSKLDLINLIEEIQIDCEKNELSLSSSSDCYFERKQSGSYYTPMDVCDLFWREFFLINKLLNEDLIIEFINKNTFIEPACGAGIFVFSLIKNLLANDISINEISKLKISCIDKNKLALDFIQDKFQFIAKKTGAGFNGLNLVSGDFLKTGINNQDKSTIYFGNPPYIKNALGSKWKNSFADFIEIALDCKASIIAFIVPMSIMFSKDYRDLRLRVVRERQSLYSANFDNIPDSLFKFGKPGGPNSNGANSQRCSIIYLLNNNVGEIKSTKLIRWKRAERKQLFTSKLQYFASYPYLDSTFIRPNTGSISNYLKKPQKYFFLDIVTKGGEYSLHVAGVARNYISFRVKANKGHHTLSFKNYEDLLTGLTILASDLFYEYWLSVGDGFHLTVKDINNFPISNLLKQTVKNHLINTEKIWNSRDKYKKIKLNAGLIIESYDFTNEINIINELKG